MPELWEWLCHLPQEAHALVIIAPVVVMFLPELLWPTKPKQHKSVTKGNIPLRNESNILPYEGYE